MLVNAQSFDRTFEVSTSRRLETITKVLRDIDIRSIQKGRQNLCPLAPIHRPRDPFVLLSYRLLKLIPGRAHSDALRSPSPASQVMMKSVPRLLKIDQSSLE